MTFSNKFSALDSREADVLDQLNGDDRQAFEQLCADYNMDFRPETDMERDSVYCIATLRWGIDRLRRVEETSREAFRTHGYMTTKIKLGLEEIASYQRELNVRYEYFFSALMRLQDFRKKAA